MELGPLAGSPPKNIKKTPFADGILESWVKVGPKCKLVHLPWKLELSHHRVPSLMGKKREAIYSELQVKFASGSALFLKETQFDVLIVLEIWNDRWSSWSSLESTYSITVLSVK